MKKEITIIGGGIAGLSIAVGLQQKGIPFRIYESATELKPLGAGIGLAFNAVRACERLGIVADIKAAGNTIGTAWITDHTGKLLSEIVMERHLELFKEVSVMVHRHDLHQALLQRLPAHCIYLGKRAQAFEQKKARTEISFLDGTKIEPEFVVAADGINSLFRRTLIPGSLPRYSGYTCWRGITTQPKNYPYKQKTIESWGKGRRLGMVPLTNDRIYWYAVMNAIPNDASMKALQKKDLVKLFEGWNVNFLNVMENTKQENIVWNDISDIIPLNQFAFGNLVLAGDAAHATTPDLGQGGGMALEDAVVLAEALSATDDFSAAFQSFEKTRLARTRKVIINSRKLANIGQLENGLLTSLRNILLRIAPEKFSVNQIKWLADTPF